MKRVRCLLILALLFAFGMPLSGQGDKEAPKGIVVDKDKKTITIAIMDAPYESGRSTTTLRLIDLAAKRGYDINVFAYEGAVLQPFAAQKPPYTTQITTMSQTNADRPG